MKLYYSKGACSLVIRILLNELGIAFESEAVNLNTKQTETGADFFKINAKGAVPALQLDNGEILTENAVIQQYLADTYQAAALLPALGDFKRYCTLEWLNFITTELHKGCGPLFNPNVSEEMKTTVFKPNLISKLKYLDELLSKNNYIMGETFSLPDAYLFVVFRWLPFLKVDTSALPALNAYFIRLKQRPAVQLALQQEGLA